MGHALLRPVPRQHSVWICIGIIRLIAGLSGAVDQRYGSSNGAEEFSRKAQLAHYENTRAQFEAFAADGVVAKGDSASDESTLTGEAIPVSKAPGDEVYSGTVNLWGAVEFDVSRLPSESTLERIIRLIKTAQKLRAPSERFTDRFGSAYTYLVIGAAGAMFLVWWLALGLPAFENGPGVRSAFYRAMTLMVVASPCALVLSIPSAILASIARGARHGILFRGGAAVERLADVNVVALDKTGTLTTGELAVERIESFPAGREREVPLPVASLVHQIVQSLVGRGYGDQDFAALLELEAQSAGLPLESENADISDGLDPADMNGANAVP